MNEDRVLKFYEVIYIYAIILAMLIYAGRVLQYKFGTGGILLTQILFILLPVYIVIKIFRLDIKKLFSFGVIGLKDLLDNISKWAISLIIIGFIGQIQLKIFPHQIKDLEMLNAFFKDTKIWQQLIIFSLTPALCEEFLFRGLIFGSLKNRMNVKWAIVISGLLFGFFHIYSGKILTTAILGMLFAYVAHKTNSLLMPMILHFINNLYVFILIQNIEKYRSNGYLLGIIGFVMIGLSIKGIYAFFKDYKNFCEGV